MAEVNNEKSLEMWWNPVETDRFLELYKQHPHLYDTKHKYYTNRTMREETLESICRELQKMRPSIKINNIKNKIKTLRSQYHREKRAVMASKDGAKLWCDNRLSFLDNFMTERRIICLSDYTHETEACSSTGDSFTGDIPQETPSVRVKVPKRKRNTDTWKANAHLALNLAIRGLTRKTDKKYDKYFAKFVAKEMSLITDPNILQKVKWKIQAAIKDGIDENTSKKYK